VKASHFDEPGQATQQVDVPANGRVRVEWWGTAGCPNRLTWSFLPSTTGTPALQDSARPVWGTLAHHAIHVLRRHSSQAACCAMAASQQEVISLPRTFTPNGGGLDVELSPSLAGSLLSALEAVEPPEALSAEATLSYFLPNLELYRALNGAGLSDPGPDRTRHNANVDDECQQVPEPAK
jgi:alpha-2-macroglobulin